jgi:hypothetical protein
MTLRIECLTVDSHDPRALAVFWEQALGWVRTVDNDVEVVLAPPGPARDDVPDLLLLKTDDVKRTKNRLHLDLRPDADRDAEVARLESLGARRVDIGQTTEESWVVLADPEGNEFCILRVLGPQDNPYELGGD